jgi:hypothetical protein
MQANKQTCGFCVEPKNEENEQPKEKVDEPSDIYDEKLIDLLWQVKEGKVHPNRAWRTLIKTQETTIQDNGLLTVKQAESICMGFYKDLVGHLESGLSTELFHGEIVFNKHLEKALK